VVKNGVSFIASAVGGGVRLCSKDEGIWPIAPGKSELTDRLHDGTWIGFRICRKNERCIAAGLTNALDLCSRISIENRTVFSKCDSAGSILDRCPVGVQGATFNVIDLLAQELEWNAQFDERLHLALLGRHSFAWSRELFDMTSAHRREATPP
jgi:hypothetical protein